VHERDLVAVGEVLLDVRAPSCVPGRTVHAPVEVRAGGTPVNAAFAVAALGGRAAVVGRVGADDAGAAVRAALANAGIDDLLALDDEAPTGASVEVGTGTARSIVTGRGASANLDDRDVPDPLAAEAVLVSGYSLLNDDTAPAAVAALARARARWVAVLMAAPGLIERCGPEGVHARAQGANVVVANEAEAAALTGRPAEGAVAVLARRYEIACVTLGSRGAVASTSAGGIARAKPTSVSETARTGAGDAFAAAFLLSLTRGATVAAALEAACNDALRLATDRPAPGRPDTAVRA
jgi:sugar/nucleoside kinase (ribokinase family)